jgi:dehydrogenase/reductase SDR family member 12
VIRGRDVRGWADRALELSVVGSWSRLGFTVRARMGGWGSEADDLRNRRVLITGGTRGIGLAAARGLLERGAHVGIVGRDPRSARRVAGELGNGVGGTVWSAGADLGDLGEVERLAGDVTEWAGSGLDGIVHGAGLLAHRWSRAKAGVETTVAVHVVGPHLLTTRLAGRLNPGARVVWVSSGGMYTQRLEVDRLDVDEETFRGSVAYARAKRAQVALAETWDRHLRGRCRSFAMHPGWVDTAALQEGLPRFAAVARPILRTPEQGADTIVWLAGAGPAPSAPSAFWHDRVARSTRRWPLPETDDTERAALWAWCQEHAGLTSMEASP